MRYNYIKLNERKLNIMKTITITKQLTNTLFETDFGLLEWQFAPTNAPTEYILQDLHTGEIYEIIESIIDDDFQLIGYLVK